MAERLKVRMSQTARRELREAKQHYEGERAGLGTQFVEEVIATIQVILERPGSFPVIRGTLRRAHVDRFPYGVFYRVVGDLLRVVGIIHMHRHPRTWRR